MKAKSLTSSSCRDSEDHHRCRCHLENEKKRKNGDEEKEEDDDMDATLRSFFVDVVVVIFLPFNIESEEKKLRRKFFFFFPSRWTKNERGKTRRAHCQSLLFSNVKEEKEEEEEKTIEGNTFEQPDNTEQSILKRKKCLRQRSEALSSSSVYHNDQQINLNKHIWMLNE